MSDHPRRSSSQFKSREEVEAHMQTPEFRQALRSAQNDMLREAERHRIVEALRHHGHATDSTAFYEAADFIEKRLS